ncbi:MAG: glycosyltransferase family 9 protein [Aggregatilineales bacterium]
MAQQRILMIRPCCIGDVILMTPALKAIRRAYPDAHISVAVGGWSRKAIEHHPAIDAILNTGNAALPVKSLPGFLSFARQLRAGRYDKIFSFVRSPLMSLAVMLSGCPYRAGIDSNGRGFGYTIRAKIDPTDARHEAEVYLDVVRAAGIDTDDCYANLPVSDTAQQKIKTILQAKNISTPYIVVNPAGGSNPGMLMHNKRWLPQNFAMVADTLHQETGAAIILLAGPDDGAILQAVQQSMQTPPHIFQGTLNFQEIGALAAGAMLYLGNDTGLTHIAAAAGAKTAMILGPSDPVRYAPYTPDSIALWKPVALNTGGVAYSNNQSEWDWERDGISIDDVLMRLRAFLENSLSI